MDRSTIRKSISIICGKIFIKFFNNLSESLNKRADFFTENYELVTSVGILGFFIGAVNQTAQKMDEFRRNTQLSIYTDKKTASVRFFFTNN